MVDGVQVLPRVRDRENECLSGGSRIRRGHALVSELIIGSDNR